MSAEIAANSCYHCGLAIPPGASFRLQLGESERQFCCPGCRAVARLIHSSGLESYYQYRTAPAELPDFDGDHLPGLLEQELRLYDDPALQQDFVSRQADGSCEAVFTMEGITCAACVWLLERQLGAMAGVISASVNLTNHRAIVRWLPEQVSLSELLLAIYRLGYKAFPFSPDQEEQLQQQEARTALRRLALAGIGMMQVMMVAIPLYTGDHGWIAEQQKQLFRWTGLLLATPVVFYSARPFFTAAVRDLRARFLTMDISVALAIAGAYVASIWSTLTNGREVYFDAVCMFTFFLLLGRFFEMKTRHRASAAGNRLLRLLPDSAIRLTGDEQQVVASKTLRAGDQVLVKTGAAIPADGVVLSGNSGVDESALTGESHAVRKQPGDKVMGGTLNLEGPLTIALTHVGSETRLSAIVRLLERARQEKPGITQLANRVASHFVLVILLVALLVFAGWMVAAPADAFWITLSVLVVTCPCALALATPVALAAATGSLSRHGVLLTRGHVLETLPKTTHVVFDKTGTLTTGKLGIDRVVPCGESDAQQAINLAAALECYSEHPIARAFASLVTASGQKPATAITIAPGQGVEGKVDNRRLRIGTAEYVGSLIMGNPERLLPPEPRGQWVVLGDEQAPIAWFRLADTVRADAAACIIALQALGLHVELLSGDPSPAAAELGRQLAIPVVIAGAAPEEKLAHVRQLQAAGASVVMVGDGINDGPVLACAQVSVAVGCASDLARVNADVLLPSGCLRDIPLLISKAGQTGAVIRQNLAWAVVYNLLALPLAAAGWIHPWMASIGMSASSLLVVANAMRLNRGWKPLRKN